MPKLWRTQAQHSSSPQLLNHDLDKRRQWMDQHGVQMIVLTLSGGMPWQWVPSAEALASRKSSTTQPSKPT